MKNWDNLWTLYAPWACWYIWQSSKVWVLYITVFPFLFIILYINILRYWICSKLIGKREKKTNEEGIPTGDDQEWNGEWGFRGQGRSHLSDPMLHAASHEHL